MNENSLIDIGKLLLVVVLFLAPMIMKFIKKQSEKQPKNKKFVKTPSTHFRSELNQPAPKVNFNEIMTDIFGVPKAKAKPINVQVQKTKRKRLIDSDFNEEENVKEATNLLSKKRIFEKIDLNINTSPKLTSNISKAAHLMQNMTNHDWKKAIIMKEILDAPVALRCE